MSERTAQGLATMLAHLESFPNQLAGSLTLPGLKGGRLAKLAPRRLILCGMGGSAISGDLAVGYLQQQPVSLDIWRNYGLPAWASSEDLVIAASYSGNTEECLSSVAEARRRGISLVGITSGGQLADQILSGETLVELPGGLPPRAALGYSFGALLGILGELGLIEDLASDLGKAIEQLRQKTIFQEWDPQAVAADLKDRIPVLYVADPLVRGVALRWKGQLNENAKVPAMVADFPELNHNDIVGWGLPAGWQDRFALVILRSGLEDERLRQRISITAHLLENEFAVVHSLTAKGDSSLAKILSFVQFGDYISYYLAKLRDVDPMPVQRIEQLKIRLAQNHPTN